MNGKKVGFKRPAGGAAANADAADRYVNQGREGDSNVVPIERTAVAPRQMVRFTLDVDADLHTRMKVKCAFEGKKMADVLRAVLEREFPIT